MLTMKKIILAFQFLLIQSLFFLILIGLFKMFVSNWILFLISSLFLILLVFFYQF
jgi:hypothetical protein